MIAAIKSVPNTPSLNPFRKSLKDSSSRFRSFWMISKAGLGSNCQFVNCRWRMVPSSRIRIVTVPSSLRLNSSICRSEIALKGFTRLALLDWNFEYNSSCTMEASPSDSRRFLKASAFWRLGAGRPCSLVDKNSRMYFRSLPFTRCRLSAIIRPLSRIFFPASKGNSLSYALRSWFVRLVSGQERIKSL